MTKGAGFISTKVPRTRTSNTSQVLVLDRSSCGFDRCANNKPIAAALPLSLFTSLKSATTTQGKRKPSKEFLYEPDLPLDFDTLVSLLRSFGTPKTLSDGERIHDLIVQSGLEKRLSLGFHMLQMYVVCGAMEDALALFSTSPQRNIASWNCMIRTYVRQGQCHQEPIRLFCQMQLEGVLPSKVTYVCMLSACVDQTALQEGKRLHARIVDSGVQSDVSVGTSLVNMYGKCGSLADAQQMFDQMPERDVVSWTAMLAIHAQYGLGKEVLQLFNQMHWEGNIPDKITVPSILNACATQRALPEGQRIHVQILSAGFEPDIVVGNALISMYGKCGSLENALTVFEKMCERDTVSWMAIITAFAWNGLVKEALARFGQMKQEGLKGDKIILVSILDACASHAALSEGKIIHANVCENGLESDIVVGNALVDMYCKCGSLKDSCTMFDKMPRRNVVTWTSMITVDVQYGHCKDALQLFDQMQQCGIRPSKVTFICILAACSNKKTLVKGKEIHDQILDLGLEVDLDLGNGLLNMYSKCGSVEDTHEVFNRMQQCDVVSWTAVIAVYTQNGHSEDALDLFEQMQREGILPDKVTFVSVLAACASLTALADGKGLHISIIIDGFESDIAIGTALITMYGKCGTLDDAYKVFDCLPRWDVTLWNAMIAVLSQNGQGKKALELFEKMQLEGVVPDCLTFLSILSACSHAGLVAEGHKHFAFMLHSISPAVDHYACMIDMLGRAGQMDDAESLICEMPFQPTIVSFMTLLGVCRNQSDVERGEFAARHAFELDPENTAPYVILWNIYTSAGREDEAEKMIKSMMDMGIKIETGIAEFFW